MNQITGTHDHDQLEGASQSDTIVGLSGDDTLVGAAGEDTLVGDFAGQNLLLDTNDATSFSQYGANGAWSVEDLGNGHSSMSQTVQTQANETYSITFEAAANIGQGHISGTVEVLWNGSVVGVVNTADAGFSSHLINLTGTGGLDELTFRTVETTAQNTGPAINTDTPIFSYEKDMQIGGETVTVNAVAPGQPNVYQVMNGTLNVFDVETKTYTQAGSDATVVINGFGFNQTDDLFYGIAVRDGVDALGNAVARNDIMMIDATGDSYRIGDGPYASWTGDFDDQGNLWSFHSSMDRVTVIDVDQFDANGNPVATVYKFPTDLVTDKVWDVAFDATTQKFYGVVKASQEGAATNLMVVDVSGVPNGEEPQFSTIPITSSLINGETIDGVPAITFGAAIIDGDGNLYVGGNGGDHDMNDATGTSGGIYKVTIDDSTGTAQLELVSASPKAYSNDGASDPRAIDPFMETDEGAVVLIRSPELTPAPDVSNSYNDTILAGAGRDTAMGGFGEDMIVGASNGDTLMGNSGDDAIYGGAGPNSTNSMVSYYDDDGNRFDQYGNLLPEDDDVISGGDGADFISGSAGHDTLSGDAGNDVLTGGSGSDIMSGGDGDDDLSGGSQDDVIEGNDGDDTLTGGTGDDRLDGGSGDDTLKAGSGNDTVIGGSGRDVIDAGTGDDVIDGGAGKDKIKAGSGNDIVNAGDGNDYINGYKGDDVLNGGAGKDSIYMGAGSDIASGGDGSDRFVFRFEDIDDNTDTITDFARDSSGKDRLDLRQLDVLSNGMTEEVWIAEHVVQQDNGDVHITIDDWELVLNDSQDQGAIFYDQVCDGLVF